MSGIVSAIFGGGKAAAPAYAPVTPAVAMPTPTTTADPSIRASGDAARRAAMGGLDSTIKTSPSGTGGGPVGYKSLLGA